jgi:MurNAc alpha-1-phosphate uridylyltransferase
MMPLTADRPKPLLDVGGKPLLEHHILNLREAGFSQLVVNAAYLAGQIEAFCGDGSRWGLEITVSVEPEPLETAGGIIQALPLLGDNPFAVVNGDIWCPYPFQTLCSIPVLPGGAHLVLTQNPEHNLRGDFSLNPAGAVDFLREQRGLTYTGIGVYHPDFFAGLARGSRPLRPLLDRAIEARLVTGQQWTDEWIDIGTPSRLASLRSGLQ